MALNENAKKWIDALRSGKYQQTKGALHKAEGFCCLGVACDLAVQAGGVVRSVHHFRMNVMYDGAKGVLPSSVRSWLGLRSAVGSSHLFPSLAGLNDAGKSFSEIADFIEQHPNELFQEE